ncbi:PBP1A family penicillin-binding protein [Candidatus Babeliales bacterium]|nr:PBP1A family penicillin-binding protein [Candidatus Babeliales bacterium]MBP9844204.1 PBP1A family penicillin-binding protein [Candidatus Babeliales bacterium]
MHLQSVAKNIFIAGFLLTAFLAGGLVFVLSSRAIDFSVLENYNPGKPSILLDDQGREWGRFQLDRRKFVSLEQMPQSLLDAFLATEDHKFYEHHGLSIRGICRSVFVNLYHGKKVQGASTITQQLVRLLFFDAKKTFKRKVKEQLFALLVEFQFTKNQILETYLNHVYFGYGIYGVQAASQRFWNKNVQDLSLDESAVLAGMVRSPTHYSPISSPAKAQKRRNVVLRLMQRRGFIDDTSCLQAQALQLEVQQPSVETIAPHLKEMIRIYLEEYVGKQQLYSGGLIIQTTINYDIQKAAEKSFHDQVTILKEKLFPGVDGGMLSITPATGEIKALVGGYDFLESKFNRVTQAKRQMGSIFKPFVYATALEHGASFIDTKIDEPIEIRQGNQVWTPQNNTRKFIGEMTLARALSYSNNTIAVQTLLDVGVEKVIEMASRLHISSELQPYPSLALGCVDATLQQAVAAFNIWANHGVYVEPHYVRWVKDELGVKIYKAHPLKEQVMDNKISSQVLKVLSLGMNRLKKTVGEQWVGGDAVGKTGTTNDSRTCWFCGSTPELTTGICIGLDNNQPLGEKVYGSRTSFPIWFGFNKLVTKNIQHFYYDPTLQEVSVDAKTGQICYDKKNPELISLLIS